MTALGQDGEEQDGGEQGGEETGIDPLDVIVKRSFLAPATLVFDAWLDPGMLANWMFNPALRNEQVLRLAIDPRVGGVFSFEIKRDRQPITYVGQYLEIARPHRLAFTWATAPESPAPEVASRVRVDIVPHGTACDLTLVQKMPPQRAKFVDAAREAWTQELRFLARTLSSDA